MVWCVRIAMQNTRLANLDGPVVTEYYGHQHDRLHMWTKYLHLYAKVSVLWVHVD